MTCRITPPCQSACQSACRFARRCALIAAASALSVPARVAAQQAATTPDSVRQAATASPRRLTKVTVTDSVRRRRAYTVARSGTATRTDALLRDVPQSVTTISRALMADQAMQGMADVVRYVPGITMAQGEGHRDAPVIRGQATTADFFIDGIRDDAQYYRDVYNVERVEALKGPNAMVFGRGGGGGVINRVTKDAQWMPTRTLRITGGSFDQRRIALDLGQGLGSTLALRLNGLYENSATFRQQSGGERIGINPTAALMFGGTLVRLGYEFYRDTRVVDRGIPSYRGAPAPAPIETFFGDPAASRSLLDAHAVAATIDRQLWRGTPTIGALQLRNRTRLTRYDKFYGNVFPGAVDASLSSVALSGYTSATDRTNLFNQTDLTTVVTHAGLKQTVLVGAELGSQRTDNARQTAYFGDPTSTASSVRVPFGRPLSASAVTFRPSAADADARTQVTAQAVYAQNQVEVGSHLQAVVGLRLDRLALDYTNNRTGEQLTRTDVRASPRAGLVLKPAAPLSLYGTVGVSYLPGSGDQFGALTVTTQALEPEQFTNRELGVKWDLRPDLAFTAAAYRLDRTNTTAPDPTTPSLVVQTGAQRTTGWEAGIAGSVTSRWQVAGGYTNQVARIVSRTSAAAAGARVPMVPRHTLSLWNRLQPFTRAGAALGVVHQASMFAAIDNTVTLPAFTRLDGAIFLTLAPSVRAQLNVENLLDRRYYATAHSNNNIMPGSSRRIRIGLDVGR